MYVDNLVATQQQLRRDALDFYRKHANLCAFRVFPSEDLRVT